MAGVEVATWGRCPKCNYIWTSADERCMFCKVPITWPKEVPTMAGKPKRVEVSQAEIGIYTYGAASKPGPIPTYEFNLTEFRDPMHRFPSKTGEDKEVQDWISSDRRLTPIIEQCLILVSDHIDHGNCKWMTLGFRDTHEKWISRAVANIVADILFDQHYKVTVIHAL